MLTTIAVIFSAASASLAVLFAYLTYSAARRVAQLAESLPSAQCSCTSRLESLSTSLVETQDALAVLANRVKMQRVRNAANHALPDEPQNVGGLKDQLRRRAGLVAGQPAKHAS